MYLCSESHAARCRGSCRRRSRNRAQDYASQPADSAVACAERSLREYGSALPDEVRRKIEEAIEEARQAAEEGNSETVDAVLAELSKLHQQLYLSQTAQQALPQHAAKPQEQAQ